MAKPVVIQPGTARWNELELFLRQFRDREFRVQSISYDQHDNTYECTRPDGSVVYVAALTLSDWLWNERARRAKESADRLKERHG